MIRILSLLAWKSLQFEVLVTSRYAFWVGIQASQSNLRLALEPRSPVATLNGTLVAIPRMIVAILENHQQSDGSVVIPKALQGLLSMERFTPVAN